jgi:acetyltransferase-like isoleucine patch superfamily enzyme
MFVLPSRLKIRLGQQLLGWDVHPTAYIGRSLILVNRLTMGPGASIGRMNVINVEELRLGEDARIGNRNHVTSFPLTANFFPHSPNRNPSLYMGKGAQITVAHEIDCSDLVEFGDYSGLAGFHCVILTHSLNIVRDRFETAPVVIGHHVGILSGAQLLSGTRVPSRCLVSAGSVVNTRLKEELTFYSGNPVEAVRSLPENLAFFHRGEEDAGHAETSVADVYR